MIINITNSSKKAAIINYGKKDVKLAAGKSKTFNIDKTDIHLTVRPKFETSYSETMSFFSILTEYHFSNQEVVTLNIGYEEAITPNDARHRYFRMADITGVYEASYSIAPPQKSKFGVDFLVSLPLTILFYGFTILFISLLVGIGAESMKAGVITFLVLTVLVALYEVQEPKIFDKTWGRLLDKLFGKKRDKNGNEIPLFFDECSRSDYIKYCFENKSR
ncbi:MAG: hypothetical protein NC110_08030 [Ruminococcus sp.]|nr:hypothetical protein [Ruminococcus sp.]